MANMDLDKINPNASKLSAMSALYWCVENDNKDLLKLILTIHFAKSKITEFQKESVFILKKAVTKGSVELLELLLKHSDTDVLHKNSDVDVCGGSLKSLLGTAIDSGSSDVVEILLQRGAMINGSYHGKPLLSLALQRGHAHLAKRLGELGADVNITDSKKESPLFAALCSDIKDNEKSHIVRWLINKGADISQKSSSGKQPIHTAAAHFPVAIIALSEAGCDVNAREGTQGNTPLHVACSRAMLPSISLLIRYGALVNCTNNLGQTPLNKLLEHASNPHDFHAKTRRSIAKVLIADGFTLSQTESKPQRKGRNKVAQLYCNIRARQSEVKRLQQLCWLQVRSHLSGTHFERNVLALDIPQHLQVYLQRAHSVSVI